MPIDLFELCSDGGGDGAGSDSDLCKIEIDKDYARRLEHNKKREELQRYEVLKKQGRISDSGSDSDSDESDDSDEIELSRHDPKFFELLNRVKNNDPEVLKKDVKFFNSDDEEEDDDKKAKKVKKVKKEKPLYLKDANAMSLLENGPDFESDEEKEEIKEKYKGSVYNEEQKAVLEDFKKAEKDLFEADDEETDDLFKEKKREDKSENDEDTLEVKQHLDAYYQGKELDENERFLKEFLEKQLWIDKQKDKNDPKPDLLEIIEEEEILEKQDKYEAKYNFRHEEENMADRVLGHSRLIEGSVRKKDNSRKNQRKSKKERMEQEERERREEVKHLKNLKKREIQEKLDKIRNIAGFKDPSLLNLDADDLEEEFNPDEYDKKMNNIFGSEYYDEKDPDFKSDNEEEFEKPNFEKEDELLGLKEGWDKYEEEEDKIGKVKISDKGKDKAEGKKGKEKMSDKVEGKKGKEKISDKEKVEIEKDLEEYYKLDYEDTIGDLKTRFKYRTVPANRYGLKPWELLTAKDENLNQYVSLKKIAPYREKEWSVTHHQKLKKGLLLGLDGEKSDVKKGDKKVKHKDEGGFGNFEKMEGENEKSEESENLSKKAKRRKRQAELKLSQSRLEAYGKIQPKKHKKN